MRALDLKQAVGQRLEILKAINTRVSSAATEHPNLALNINLPMLCTLRDLRLKSLPKYGIIPGLSKGYTCLSVNLMFEGCRVSGRFHCVALRVGPIWEGTRYRRHLYIESFQL